MGDAIVIDWATGDAHLAFDAPRLVLAAPQLLDNVTDVRIASIIWVPAAGFTLAERDGEAVGWEHKGTGEWAVRTFALERGGRYVLSLKPAARAALERRGTLRYAELYDKLDGMVLIQSLSTAFYTRVFASDVPSFRSAFAEKVTGVAQAAANQSEWFAGYWGKLSDNGQ